MSLFDKFNFGRVSSTPEKERSSDLNLFLNILKDIRGHTGETYSEFFNVLMDPRKACITGSAVLGKKINRDEIAKDIDIFVDDRDASFQKILRDFFSEVNVKNNFWPSYRDKVGISESDRNLFVAGAILQETSSEDYLFKIGAYSLRTFNVTLGKNILLNFILLDNANSKELSPVFSPDLINANYPFPDNLLHDLIARGKIKTKEEMQDHSSFVLEYIDSQFDMQELKSVWDFETETCLNVYEVTEKINDGLIERLTNVESTKFTDLILKRAVGAKILFKEKSIYFKENFSDPEKMTISSERGQRFQNVSMQVYSEMDELLMGGKFTSVAEDFASISKRIKKYQRKGFKIEDPASVITILHSNLLTVSLGSLLDPVINSMERQSIFNSDSIVKKKYLTINRLKILLEEKEQELGLELVKKEPEPDTTKDTF